jgi:uncharacterized membrane protein
MDPSPYDAPQATLLVVDDPSESGFLREPREVELGAGMEWLAEGWRYFLLAPGPWIAILVLWFVLVVVLAFIPLIGSLATNLLMPVVSAGIVLGCDALRRGQPLGIEHLFAGFSTNFAQLLLVGLINLGIGVLMGVVLLGVMFGGLAMSGDISTWGSSAGPGVGFIVVMVVAVLAVSIPLAMAMAFAPALVALNGLGAVEAMLLSLKACARNFLALLILGFIVVLLAIVAVLPLGLGLIVAAPVFMATNFVAYRAIFYDQP